ncbi:LytR/AlgR family response regulator transcription factor [Salegentibacter chungangensis]|uniref:LytR/AlgR family response regulator transcription factor n=1 Tax=Salegentibacter chungangensis TaxID=1335724 RepID=A0ABW3NLU1_9FLAO
MSEVIKCIIVDDEPHAIRLLEKYTDQLPQIDCLATSTKPLEAIRLIEQHKPDLILLDIQMPDLTGLQLSRLIKDETKLIFTTAYSEFAVEGFELNAVDYLLKPISLGRFIEAIEKVKSRNTSTQPARNSAKNEDYFFVKTDGKNKFRKIDPEDILYLESIRNYVVIHTPEEQIITYNTLKHFEESLPEESFIKIHKSYIVALNKISKTDNHEIWLGENSLPLGDTHRREFFKRIEDKKL